MPFRVILEGLFSGRGRVGKGAGLRSQGAVSGRVDGVRRSSVRLGMDDLGRGKLRDGGNSME